MTQRQSYVEALIAAGATGLSGEIDLRSHDVIGIEMPATWVAAAITFQGTVRNDGASNAGSLTETFQDVFDSAGAEIVLTVVQAHYVVLTQAHIQALRGLSRVKIRSGISGAAVDQTASRMLRLVLGQELG